MVSTAAWSSREPWPSPARPGSTVSSISSASATGSVSGSVAGEVIANPTTRLRSRATSTRIRASAGLAMALKHDGSACPASISSASGGSRVGAARPGPGAGLHPWRSPRRISSPLSAGRRRRRRDLAPSRTWSSSCQGWRPSPAASAMSQSVTTTGTVGGRVRQRLRQSRAAPREPPKVSRSSFRDLLGGRRARGASRRDARRLSQDTDPPDRGARPLRGDRRDAARGQLDDPGSLPAAQGDPHGEGPGRGRPRPLPVRAAETLGADRADLLDRSTPAARSTPRSSTTRPSPRPTSAPSDGWSTARDRQPVPLFRCSYGPYTRAMVRVCKEESFHQRQGFEILHTLAHGTPAQHAMAQDAVDRYWWPSLMMFGPPDDDSPNSAQSMAWRIKRFCNDDLRQRFVDMTVPQAEAARADASRPGDPLERRSAALRTSARWTSTELFEAIKGRRARATSSGWPTGLGAHEDGAGRRGRVGVRREAARVRAEARGLRRAARQRLAALGGVREIPARAVTRARRLAARPGRRAGAAQRTRPLQRRQEGVSIWVVRSADIEASTPGNAARLVLCSGR